MERFANFWKGIFFLVSSVSMVVAAAVFLLVWQPIWTAGFKDFHTISNAIDQLDETIRPASSIAPQLLVQITEMNESMQEIRTAMDEMEQIRRSMVDMQTSMEKLEEMNPNIVEMSGDMKYMTWVMSNQMNRMSYGVNRIGNKFSPLSMLPFNW